MHVDTNKEVASSSNGGKPVEAARLTSELQPGAAATERKAASNWSGQDDELWRWLVLLSYLSLQQSSPSSPPSSTHSPSSPSHSPS